jgi:predicted NUDIX family NTP pyrophosphohydrolase
MAKSSAGILMYRRRDGAIELLLVHPGGPFWAKRDKGAWSIPKGEYAAGEDALAAAKREFHEELGVTPQGRFIELGAVKQAGGKSVTAFGLEGDFDPAELRCNEVALEWPPRSGRMRHFAEVDRAAWLSPDAVRSKINPGQA